MDKNKKSSVLKGHNKCTFEYLQYVDKLCCRNLNKYYKNEQLQSSHHTASKYSLVLRRYPITLVLSDCARAV